MMLRSHVRDVDDLYRRPTSRASSPPTSPRLDADAEGYSNTLKELLSVLQSKEGLKMFKRAYRTNMQYKVARYDDLAVQATREVAHEKALLDLKTPDLKTVASIDGTQDNWAIFETIGKPYMEAKERVAIFEAIRDRAKDKLAGGIEWPEVRSGDPIYALRDVLVAALTELTNFSAQAHVVTTVLDIVGAFLKNPQLIQTKFLNFMMVGAAGTGKTTLAKVIANAFAAAGMFVGDKVTEAGRAEFVGEYEGQTVARTRSFLVSHLDRGVVFVDEAYALTQWSNGKPEGYGSEAVTAMVEFMTKYKGLYCLITAGYEKEMTRYFLPTNPGLTRRFPYRFVLRDLSADDLLYVFKRTLLSEQKKEVPLGRASFLESEHYFTPEAWDYLRDLVAKCTSGVAEYDAEEYDAGTKRTYKNVRRFTPTYPLLYTLFENQAGSMTNLAEEAVTVLMRTVSFKDTLAVAQKTGGVVTEVSIKTQDESVMRDIVVQRILNSALSESDDYLDELEQVEGASE